MSPDLERPLPLLEQLQEGEQGVPGTPLSTPPTDGSNNSTSYVFELFPRKSVLMVKNT